MTRARFRARLPRGWGCFAAGGLWLLFFANFVALRLEGGDTAVQFAWIQDLFGDRVDPWGGTAGSPTAIGYFFGLGLLEAPYYGLGKVLEALGIHSIGGHPIKPALIAIGMGLLVLPAGALVVRMLSVLRLAAAGFATLMAVLGTSLVFWAVFAPGKNHPADAALFTLVLYLVLRYFREGEAPRWLIRALGGVLGFSITVRYFAGAEAVALVALLIVYRRWRDGAELAIATTAATCLLFLVPIALGTPVFSGYYTTSNEIGFYPLNPLRMLFTDFRGMFVWTPVTLLAVVGLALVYVRRPEHRRFLVAAYLMGAAIVLSYAFVPYWDGGRSFSQRFYTPLFPLVAIGLAGLFEAARGVIRAAAALAVVAATAWSLYLCFNLVTIGEAYYPGPIFTDGAWGVAELPTRMHISAGEYAWAVYYRSRLVKRIIPWPFSHSGATP